LPSESVTAVALGVKFAFAMRRKTALPAPGAPVSVIVLVVEPVLFEVCPNSPR
jgi:hypothetical protein